MKKLSSGQLIDILFSLPRPHHTQESAHGKMLLKHAGSLTNILSFSPLQLKQYNGIGNKKAYRLSAALEIFRRAQQEKLAQDNVFTNIDTLKMYLRSHLQYESREIFLVLFLDHNHRLLHAQELFLGTISEVVIYPREILRAALLYQSPAFIVAHNHPKGNLRPSPCDFEMTHLLAQACQILDLSFLDHFLISNEQVVSFSDQGWMESFIQGND